MSGETFDTAAWLRRIGYAGPLTPTLAVLRAIAAAHSATIPFENVDVLLGRVPSLDLGPLQAKLVGGGRGGYCFELNALLRAGLLSLGFSVTGLIARVIRGQDAEASGPATHMTLRVDLPEGPFLADVGFGNQTPTAPLSLRAGIEQKTPHEVMRLVAAGQELTLQAKLGDGWENIYRVSPHAPLDIDYTVGNWFTATHPASPFVSNMIVARPGPDGVRNTLFNGRLTVRRPPVSVARTMLDDPVTIAATLTEIFGLTLPAADLTAALETLDRKGTRGAAHPSFA